MDLQRQVLAYLPARSLTSVVHLSTCLSVCLSVRPSVCLSVCLSVCVCLCLTASIHLSLSIYLSNYLSIHLAVCLSIYLPSSNAKKVTLLLIAICVLFLQVGFCRRGILSATNTMLRYLRSFYLLLPCGISSYAMPSHFKLYVILSFVPSEHYVILS